MKKFYNIFPDENEINLLNLLYYRFKTNSVLLSQLQSAWSFNIRTLYRKLKSCQQKGLISRKNHHIKQYSEGKLLVEYQITQKGQYVFLTLINCSKDLNKANNLFLIKNKG